MNPFSAKARLAAGAIALTALIGLAAQFQASSALAGSAQAALWAMLRYFTVLANLALIVACAGMAIEPRRFSSATALGGVTLAMLLVGVVYGVLLKGLLDLSGNAKLADLLLHHVTPILSPLFWLGFAPKGRLGWRAPLVWAIFPLAYLAYALVRGSVEPVYAYPFIDVRRIGWGRTSVNAVAIAAGFLIAGYALIWLDKRLVRVTRG